MSEIQTPPHLLYEAVYVLYKRKIVILLAFIATLIGILLGSFIAPQQWNAITKVMVLPNPRLQAAVFQKLVQNGQLNPQTKPSKNMVEILTGMDMATNVVREFHLDHLREIRDTAPENPRDKIKYWTHWILIDGPCAGLAKLHILPPANEDFFGKAVDDFSQNWADISSGDDDDMTLVGVWGNSPKSAREIALFMAQRLQQQAKDLSAGNIARALDFAEGQIPSVEQRLRTAEEALRDFRKENSASLDYEISKAMDRMSDLDQHISDAKVSQGENVDRTRELKNQLTEEERSMVASGFIAGNTVVVGLETSLSTMISQLASMMVDKRPEHPDVVALNAQIQRTRELLADEVRRIVASKTETMSNVHDTFMQQLINAEVDEFVYAARLKANLAEKEKLGTDLKRLAELKTAQDRLAREVDIQDGVYRDLKSQVTELKVLSATDASEFDIRIVDRGYVSDRADTDWPNWKIVIPLAFAGALLFALLVPFFVEYWNDSIRPWEVEPLLDKPVAGEIDDVSQA